MWKEKALITNMTAYENLTEYTEYSLLEPESECGKVIRYKVNIQKSTVFLQTNSKQLKNKILNFCL